MLAQETTTPGAARQAIRSGDYRGHTAGLAPGYVQGNLVILPEILARDFIRFCQRNPKPCPLLAVSEPGDPSLPMLGRDIDVRTDLPRYRVWVHGVMVEEVTDLKQMWRDDFVSFVLGCSFSFEQELIRCGISLRHITEGKNVAMFQTNVPNVPAGRFGGSLVVTMRPMRPADAIRAIQITSRFPGVHGAPVHFGDPAAIGITDLTKPDFGDPVEILAGEIPVFWACGVTPQVAVREARPEICITHVPGSMIITDVLNTQLAVL